MQALLCLARTVLAVGEAEERELKLLVKRVDGVSAAVRSGLGGVQKQLAYVASSISHI